MSTDENVKTSITNDLDTLEINRAVAPVVALPFSQRLRERLLYLVALTGVDLIALMVMTATLVGTVISMGRPIRFFQASVGFPLSIMAGVLLVKAIQAPRDFTKNAPAVLRDWVPFLFISFIYENMHDVAGHVMTFDIAGFLYDWDVVIFGIEPTLWMQKFYHPLLTDFMAFSYALYFVFALVLMFFLSLHGHRRAFRHIAMALTFSFMMGFVGYIFFPCSPPRYFINEMFATGALHGPLLYDRLQAMWDGFSVVGGGAFPSLHVGISSVALIYAWKYRYFSRLYQVLFYIYLPLVVSLWISTVYLRHHWVIDIFAGWAVAYIGYRLAEFSLRKWSRLRRRFAFPL